MKLIHTKQQMFDERMKQMKYTPANPKVISWRVSEYKPLPQLVPMENSKISHTAFESTDRSAQYGQRSEIDPIPKESSTSIFQNSPLPRVKIVIKGASSARQSVSPPRIVSERKDPTISRLRVVKPPSRVRNGSNDERESLDSASNVFNPLVYNPIHKKKRKFYHSEQDSEMLNDYLMMQKNHQILIEGDNENGSNNDNLLKQKISIEKRKIEEGIKRILLAKKGGLGK